MTFYLTINYFHHIKDTWKCSIEILVFSGETEGCIYLAFIEKLARPALKHWLLGASLCFLFCVFPDPDLKNRRKLSYVLLGAS